ncbi:YceI family protein [soil metagenome]
MRSWFTLILLVLLPLPALAGPQDPWTIDPRASALTFSVSQIGSIVSGRFATWTGDIVLDPSAPAGARIDIRIEMPSATTNNRDVDSLMKGANFLDVQKFSAARFTATSITPKGGDRYEARGKLTIRDVTRDATLPFTLAIAEDTAQSGRQRATARGRLIIKRLDYGVGQNEWAGIGQVADEVTIDVNVVASRPR